MKMLKINTSLIPSGAVQFKVNRIILLLMFSVLFLSCKEEDVLPQKNEQPDVTADVVDTYINDWILENMEYWYLWNDELPAAPDKELDPASFFSSLLHDEDRFSWLQDNYVELLNSLQGISKEAGYEFVLYRESDSGTTVVAQVLYIKPGSPASAAGLKRGDLITHINGKQITTANYRDLLQDIKEDHTLQYKPLLIDAEKFDDPKNISLTTVEYTENPNFLSKVLDVKEKKIGYYVYNFFASGTDADQKKYDAEMDAIFADFKAKGITDLILDFRFNSGGSETSANNLASLIAPGVDASMVFFKRQYNEQIQGEIRNTSGMGESFLTSYFKTKSANIGNQLEGGKVYVLTSSRTASASELVINCLKPYMQVILIGDVTYGKNVGSISLYEEDDPKNTWGLQPIVVKAFNSLDQSEYGNGFMPDLENKDNSLYLYPLGDPRESMLAQAISHITGDSSLARESDITARDQKELIGHSLDVKRRSFSLIIDQDNW